MSAVVMRYAIVRFEDVDEPYWEIKQVYLYPDDSLHFTETGELYGCKVGNLRNVAEMIYNDTRDDKTIFVWDGSTLVEE